MALSEIDKNEFMKRILMSRMRILGKNGFYGLLLMHMTFAIDDKCKTAFTDGRRIVFGTSFLRKLSNSELDFVMMHEILHVVLQHCFRTGNRDNRKFNIACDIVVNSNILLSENKNLNAISLREYGVSMHLAPNKREGYEYTAEQVYEMLLHEHKKNQSRYDKSSFDDHSSWGKIQQDEILRDEWIKHLRDACQAISAENSLMLPAFALRFLSELKNPQTDWRLVLNDFVQKIIADYSFTPPDYRFEDCPFYLPSFSDRDFSVDGILFMVDTSASISDKMLTMAYTEIKGAIDCFDGKLQGWLGFFDAKVTKPIPFSNENEIRKIKPIGGGGTDFEIIFEYIQKNMKDSLPNCIIILTDGCAPFPDKKVTCGIPVLWIINNDAIVPPWGKVTRIKIENDLPD